MEPSIFSITRSWIREPINWPEETKRLLVVSAVALLIIGMGAISYVYGVQTPLYNHVVASCFWGVAGGAVLCTPVVYIVKSVLRRKYIEQESSSARISEQELEQKYQEIYTQLFEGISVDELLDFTPNLKGDTGYFDQVGPLQSYFSQNESQSIIYGKQDGRPFLGVHLCIHYSWRPHNVILLIAPTPDKRWYVHVSQPLDLLFSPSLSSGDGASVCLEWLKAILAGKMRQHLQFNVDQGSDYYTESQNGPKVSLYNHLRSRHTPEPFL